MKKLLAGITACLASIGAASAQSTSTINWSGAYVSGSIGGAAGDVKTTAMVAPGGTYFTGADFAQLATAGDGSLSTTRLSGGIAAGYGWQFNKVLLGVEASAHSLSFDDSRSRSEIYITAPTARYTFKQSVEANWMATLRGKLGWAQDNWIMYLTGGLAYTQVKLGVDFNDNFSFGGLVGANGRSSNTDSKLGWTLGLGSEYALNRNWSVRGDYLYADFGRVKSSTNINHANPAAGRSVLNSSADLKTHLLQIGVNYRFN